MGTQAAPSPSHPSARQAVRASSKPYRRNGKRFFAWLSHPGLSCVTNWRSSAADAAPGLVVRLHAHTTPLLLPPIVVRKPRQTVALRGVVSVPRGLRSMGARSRRLQALLPLGWVLFPSWRMAQLVFPSPRLISLPSCLRSALKPHACVCTSQRECVCK
jgi:hypothetical protein